MILEHILFITKIKLIKQVIELVDNNINITTMFFNYYYPMKLTTLFNCIHWNIFYLQKSRIIFEHS